MLPLTVLQTAPLCRLLLSRNRKAGTILVMMKASMTTLKRKTLCHMVFEGDCLISMNTVYTQMYRYVFNAYSSAVLFEGPDVFTSVHDHSKATSTLRDLFEKNGHHIVRSSLQGSDCCLNETGANAVICIDWENKQNGTR